MTIESVSELQEALRSQRYIADRGLAMAIYLSLKLRRPLFLEGEAGVGKTEVAKVIAGIYETDLIRLQCYEGLDIHHAVYEWNYTRQMLHIRLMEAQGERTTETELFGPEYLLRRPLLKAIETTDDRPPVLLIDEIDRSDEQFEAYLLEVLSDFQITIPEIGTIKASQPPIVILTSNRTREVHDALKRRCLYYWIDYPSFDKELEIVRAKVPEASETLASQVTTFIQELRRADLYKLPGIAETLEWTAALVALDQEVLEPSVVDDTLGVILKYQDDISSIKGNGSRNIVRAIQRNGS
ncbi:MAG: MoxR family ATPase [Candidatus Promineifilaceae bacterium]